jgi:crotonobetainyl-CoA:carnitine CoA-transferase CaiB-like acyl-CoA transferase
MAANERPSQPEAGPLHGYTVVELATGIAGVYCTKLLADGGAQVINVESPQGDPALAF